MKFPLPLLGGIVALLNVAYMSSYMIFSHGAFVKYELLKYILGLALIFSAVFVFNFASIAYSTWINLKAGRRA